MSNKPQGDTPMSPHISYSALSTYLDCGEKYRLQRIEKVPENPAWYLIGGKAVHTASELFDKKFPSASFTDEEVKDFSPTQTFAEAWNTELSLLLEQGFEVEDFKAGGRSSRAWPNKENSDWWLENGPKMVANWILWRRGSGWSLWPVAGSGEPAVELGIDYVIGDDTVVKMYIDRIMVTPAGELVVVDLKTGARTPSSDLQLAVYAAGLEEKFGVRPQYGAYWMAREGSTSMLSDLEYLSKTRVERVATEFDRARKSGIFLPNLSNCGYCSVAQHCEWSKK